MNIIPKAFDYQRNGVSGRPFYTLLFDWSEKSENEKGSDFIATFESDDDDQKVIYETCRIVDPKKPLSDWRGDNFGLDIEKTLKDMQNKEKLPYLSDLQFIINGMIH